MKPFTLKDLRENQLQIYCNKNACIFEYQIIFTENNGESKNPAKFSNTLELLAEHFKNNDNVCLFEEGSDIVYLKKKLMHKVSTFTLQNLYSTNIEVTVKYCRHIKLKFAYKFFQTLLFTKIVDHLNDIGDPYEVSNLNLSRLYCASLTQGFWQGNVKTIADNSSGIAIQYEVAQTLTCQLTIYEFMRREILKHQHKEDCLEIVKKAFIGKTVMTRYNNKTYRIHGIDFSTNPTSSFLSDNGELITFAEYYKNKYGIEVRNLYQPILIHQVFEKDSNIKNQNTIYVHCLLPEFCYPVYSEWNPMECDDVYYEFCECLRINPIVKDILSEWELSLEPTRTRNTCKPIILYDRLKAQIPREIQKKKSLWNILNIFSR